MTTRVAFVLVVSVALVFNLLGILLKIGYESFADDVLIAGAALAILGTGLLLSRQERRSTKLPVVLLASALLSCLCYLLLGNLFFYDDKRLQTAWQRRETQYPRQWIAHLRNLKFEEFGDRMTTFATTANFCFGYLDTEKGQLAKIPKNRQQVIKHNCMLVNTLYINSDLFKNQCISYKKSLFIQEKYFSDSVFISRTDSLAIKAALDSVANE